jgi:hypothetical protein
MWGDKSHVYYLICLCLSNERYAELLEYFTDAVSNALIKVIITNGG